MANPQKRTALKSGTRVDGPFAPNASRPPADRTLRPPSGRVIAIAGLVGSGKNTAGALVAKKLGWTQVEPTFKTLAEREGISLMEFQEKAKKDETIDLKFDAALRRECAGKNCVVTTWLGPWMAPGKPYRVWLDVPQGIRAERIANRDGMTPEAARAHVRRRDEDNRARYKKAYGIDILDHSEFELVVKVRAETAEKIAKTILDAYRKRTGT